MNDPHSGIATASQAYTNNDLGMKPTPFTTTIGSHVVQVLSSSGTVLVDGESITLGRGSKVVSGTPIFLQQDGGLIIGTSTIKSLLPNPLPTLEESDHLGDPEMNDPYFGIATASQAYTNNDLGMKPTPFTTTIGSHVVQVLSSSGTVLVDGESITLGRGSKVVSGTPIFLQQDGGLVIGTSTIKNLLPNPLPTPNALFAVSNEILGTNQNSPDTISYPTSPPQVYRVGSISVTAGGPPITYSGTKIQAFNGGSIVVGDSTYHATPTPAAMKAVSGAQDSGISNSSAGNTNSSSGNVKADGLTRSETGDALNASIGGVMPYQGIATRGRVGWSLLCGSIIPFIGQLRF